MNSHHQSSEAIGGTGSRPSRIRPELAGIVCIVVGITVIALQDIIIKWISDRYPLHEIVFGRSFVALLVTAVFLKLEGGFRQLLTRNIKAHIGRGLLLVVANSAYFAALASLPIAEAMAIFFVAPVLITALSVPLLGEKVGGWRWSAVLIGLAGVIVMLRPGNGIVDWVALLPLCAASAYAVMQIITRRIGLKDKASVMSFYVHLTFIVFGATVGLVAGDGSFNDSSHPSLQFLLRAWTWPDAAGLALIASCGLCVGIAGYLLAQAYRIAEATLVAPFEYVALPIAIVFGILLWGDWPDLTAIIGITMIVGGGLLVLYRETLRGRKPRGGTPDPAIRSG